MASAIQRERQAALASTAAIKGRNAALAATPRFGRAGNNGFETANIAAQFQDIAVTSAMGMNPLQIALQQGTQLSSVLGTMGNGRQVVAGLAAAFTSLISPVSLVTIGLVAGGAAAIQYFSSLELGGAKSEATLKKEAELVQAVVSKWGEALPALKAYNDERQRAADAKETAEALDVGRSGQWDELRKQLGDVDTQIGDIVSRISQMGEDASEVIKLQATFSELTKGIDEGKASVDLAKRAHKELAEIVKNNASPELQAYLEIFEKLIPVIDAASRGAQKFDRDAAIALTSRHPSRGTYGGVERSADGAIQGGGFRLPEGGPVPGRRPLIELEGLPGEQKKAETAAQRAANAYRDLVKSADDRIAQLQLETELTGEYGVQTDAARFRLELLQQAEDKGRSLSAEQRAEIEKKVELYSKYSQALAQAKLHQDLLDDSAFAGLSKQEQAVKLRLRSYGLDEDLGGNNAAMIRNRFQQEELSDLTQSFLSEFSSGILAGGKSIGEILR
ncbi:phage tail length tape measure family protein [Sinorhizobium medicae]|uniref:phage tail length tape measure family protein n=1 Tax=Sinorhizobium medicae TaxID=110321 RepID=UPI002AF6B3D7|nr:phage tail length tape measure family protein [Sinorhizobium medicae]WQO84016.1 phage tail length tape measure family protein [Sinorhizobium medicae]